MKEYFHEHATILADHCLQVEPEDNILVQAPFVAEPLVLALAEVLGERNASMHVFALSDRIREPYLNSLADDSVPEPTHTVAAFENADGVIVIQGAANTAELHETSPEIKAAYTEALEPVRAAMLDDDWVVTQYPAPGDAQAAGMATTEYREFIQRTVTLDWDKQSEFEQPLAERLDEASKVRVKSNETDLQFSVEGMRADDGYETARVNLPDGEVGTAPVPDSVGDTFCSIFLFRSREQLSKASASPLQTAKSPSTAQTGAKRQLKQCYRQIVVLIGWVSSVSA